MKLKQSDVRHLRRLLGYVRCEIGQSPDEMVSTVRNILAATGNPDEAGKDRLAATEHPREVVQGEYDNERDARDE